MASLEDLVEMATCSKMVSILAKIICDTPDMCPPRDPAHPCSNPGPEWNRDGACENCWINWARRVVVK